MKTKKYGILYFAILTILLSFYGCTNKQSEIQNSLTNTEDAMKFLNGLEGKWIAVLDGDQSTYGFEYILSARDKVIIERLRTDIPTEMLTVYNLDNGILRANHFCQLQNQPNLIAVTSEDEGDLNFLCVGEVGNTKTHDELHMHGYHLMKTDSGIKVWMDMYQDGATAFQSKYELFRVDSERGQELTNLEQKH
ncbi:hypothetical protein [Maribacter sp. HTCC2170]|uniref:hypothetical protein n=1 Tax=Maribacter sp. (strain HTCC2170 / KCCM 42371) TaxID=313603 RepID=UPI00006BB85E|nr:hypothetical protein [Maribacter sp. HTCC2170]EAQ99705.1 hypothetical protein FB2170_10344 [Maribacter sp. HTCC2170]